MQKSTATKSSKSRALDRNGQEGNATRGREFESSEPPQPASRTMISMGHDSSEGLAAGGSSEAVGSHPLVSAPFASLGGPTPTSQPPPSSHAFDNLDSVDLPQYVKAHITTLTFPEKVRIDNAIHAKHLFCSRGIPYY
jgi:hypothetical protein